MPAMQIWTVTSSLTRIPKKEGKKKDRAIKEKKKKDDRAQVV